MQKILVWDWPVRLGHWLMVGGFILAWLTSESETFRRARRRHLPPALGLHRQPLCALCRFRSRSARRQGLRRRPAQARAGPPCRPQSGRRLGHRPAARPRHPHRPLGLGELQRHRRRFSRGAARRTGRHDAHRGLHPHCRRALRKPDARRKPGAGDAERPQAGDAGRSHPLRPAAGRRGPAGVGRRRSTGSRTAIPPTARCNPKLSTWSSSTSACPAFPAWRC